MSHRSIAALRGRLEYDAERWELLYGDGSCSLRLVLFDLPARATVKLETWHEAGTRHEHRTRAALVPPAPKGQRSRHDYREAFTLARGGRFRVQIRTQWYIHVAEYRIDDRKRRPIRSHRDKLELFVEDHFYDQAASAYGKPRQEEPPAIPGSLWSYARDLARAAGREERPT